MASVLILVGTKKGLFILQGDEARRSWELRGPFCETWPIQHAIADPATGAIYAAGGNAWFGAAIWKSTDLGATWTHSSAGLGYGEGEEPVAAAWSLAVAPDGLYAGVEPAGPEAARAAGEVRPQASRALWAASSASSMSAACERAAWQKTLPVTGETLSKYCPSTGATHLPPMKLS
mgnify:CR=1 FL=1